MTDEQNTETVEYYPIWYLVNHKQHKVEIERCDEKDLVKWFNDGYRVTDKRSYYDYGEKFALYWERRHKKTAQQRLRRLQGYTPPKRK